MARLSRIVARIFGRDAVSGEMGVYGSLAAASPTTTTDPAVMQAQTQWLGGLFSALVGDGVIAKEDMNAVLHVHSRQIAYLLEAGVPEWDTSTTYWTGDIVQSGGVLFVSLTDSNAANAVTDQTNWQVYGGGSSRNFLANGNFYWWQRKTSDTIANSISKYVADRWYGKNSLGTNGVLTCSRVTGTTNGSPYALKLQITTAPTASQANGCELYQTIENPLAVELYGKTASFGIKVKAFGNVTQVGVQFMYKTTEAKVDTVIGSEQTFTVNTSSFVNCRISGQALGTSMTTAGVVGVRIRITGVSSGNTYDLNNGFSVEQAIMNIGVYPDVFHPMHPSPSAELNYLYRFYEKTYNFDQFAGDAVGGGNLVEESSGLTNRPFFNFRYKAIKRTFSVTTNVYSVAGTVGKCTANGSDQTCSDLGTGGDTGTVYFLSGTSAAGNQIQAQFTADAEI